MGALKVELRALLAAAAVMGCGGSTLAVPGNDGGNDGGHPDGGGTGDSGETCPTSAPTSGTPCQDFEVECEYGTSANVSCNQLLKCIPDCDPDGCPTGTWTNVASSAPCVTGCPSTYASVPVTTDCQTDGLVCGYAQGTCTCSNGGVPHPGGPAWDCFPAQSGCPSPRPNLGTSCTAEGQSCDYGSCYGGIAVECSHGSWQETMTACPASASAG
jgi:hypothetical protein